MIESGAMARMRCSSGRRPVFPGLGRLIPAFLISMALWTAIYFIVAALLAWTRG